MTGRSKKAEQVLDAAKHLFIEQGFGATSMDAIAADAAVSKATVYAHYPSKEALFAATARRECSRITRSMAISAGIADLPLDIALERIGRSFFDAVMCGEILSLLRMVISEAPRFPEIGAIYYDCGPGVVLEDVSAYMRRARANGRIRADDCGLAASQFLALLRGDLHLQRLVGVANAHHDATPAIRAAVETFVASYGTTALERVSR